MQVENPFAREHLRGERFRERLSMIYKIAIMSGKGGVGKTTIAANIACMLAKKGKSVGLLDADIDCPNLPNVMGIDEKFENIGNILVPPKKHGVKVSSMALFGADGPAMWRGPMIHSAIMQLLEMTDWNIEYLVIDMPPGTSDASLTVMQFVGIDAAVVVTTSQELAVADASKSAKMAMNFHKPAGIVENMSGEVFGSGGGETLARDLSLPFLGRIDLAKQVRECCDRGVPAVVNGVAVKDFEIIVANLERLIHSGGQKKQ